MIELPNLSSQVKSPPDPLSLLQASLGVLRIRLNNVLREKEAFTKGLERLEGERTGLSVSVSEIETVIKILETQNKTP